MDLDVRLIEVFRHEQRGALTHAEAAVSLHVSGLRHHRLPGYERRNPGPFLILAPPGMHVEFEFGPDRENWVVLLVSDDVRPGSLDGMVAVRAGAADPWTEVPYILEVSEQELPLLQQAFMELREAFHSPLASARLRMHIGILALIGRCLGGAPAPASRDPAALLKRLIDEDPLGQQSLATLSRGCGMSVDHLRLRFKRTYGVTPLAYRQRQRLAEAHRLLSTTRLPVGEIAEHLGYRHASHFCAVFRARFGLTPVASRRHFGLGGG